jgi:CBS domain-containing protein
MLVGNLCKRDVVTIQRRHGVVEAARRMRERRIGELVVLAEEHDAPVGVLTDYDLVAGILGKSVETDRDVVVSILAKDAAHLAELEVGDVLTSEVVTAREDEDLNDVLHRMQLHSLRRIPVVNQTGSLVGIFALDDILGLVAGDMASVVALVQRHREHEARV